MLTFNLTLQTSPNCLSKHLPQLRSSFSWYILGECVPLLPTTFYLLISNIELENYPSDSNWSAQHYLDWLSNMQWEHCLNTVVNKVYWLSRYKITMIPLEIGKCTGHLYYRTYGRLKAISTLMMWTNLASILNDAENNKHITCSTVFTYIIKPICDNFLTHVQSVTGIHTHTITNIQLINKGNYVKIHNNI